MSPVGVTALRVSTFSQVQTPCLKLPLRSPWGPPEPSCPTVHAASCPTSYRCLSTGVSSPGFGQIRKPSFNVSLLAEANARAALAEARLFDFKTMLDDIWEQRDRWQQQAERVAALAITDQRKEPTPAQPGLAAALQGDQQNSYGDCNLDVSSHAPLHLLWRENGVRLTAKRKRSM